MFRQRASTIRYTAVALCGVLVSPAVAWATPSPRLESATVEIERLRGLRNASIEFERLRGLRSAAIGFEPLLDCNTNEVLDYEDIAEGTSADANDNGVPDECDSERPMAEDCATIGAGAKCGPATCTTDADCHEESHCVITPGTEPPEGVCYAPKLRHLSIAANSGQVPDTGRRVKLDDGAELGWVGDPSYVTPFQEPAGFWLATIQATPHYETTWPDVVHVTGCEIAHASLSSVTGVHCLPNAPPDEEDCVQHMYHIQAIRFGQDIGNEHYYSEVLELRTNTTWGDTVSTIILDNGKPPNGIIGVEDIMAAIKKYQIVDVAPLVWLDIAYSTWADVPDQVIGVDDIMNCIDGYQGKPYPGLGPLNCP